MWWVLAAHVGISACCHIRKILLCTKEGHVCIKTFSNYALLVFNLQHTQSISTNIDGNYILRIGCSIQAFGGWLGKQAYFLGAHSFPSCKTLTETNVCCISYFNSASLTCSNDFLTNHSCFLLLFFAWLLQFFTTTY